MREFLKSLSNAVDGLITTTKTQRNFVIHIIIAVIVIVFSIIFGLDTEETLWIVASILIVLMTELLNTSIENLVDLVEPQFRDKAKIAKDASAAMVLIASFLAVFIGCIIFCEKIFGLKLHESLLCAIIIIVIFLLSGKLSGGVSK